MIIDNNSKFGTLIFLRKSYKIERKKIALQIGRTVITFSLKQTSINNIPVFKNPNLMDKFSKTSPKSSMILGKLPTSGTNSKQKNLNGDVAPQDSENNANNKPDQNGSFIDD